MFMSKTIIMSLIAGGLIAGLWSCSKGPAKKAAPVIRPVRTLELTATGKGFTKMENGYRDD